MSLNKQTKEKEISIKNILFHKIKDLFCSLFSQSSTFGSYINTNKCNKKKYGLLTKCEVKMAGYWPSSYFASLWTETKVEVHKLAKKERGQYPAILT